MSHMASTGDSGELQRPEATLRVCGLGILPCLVPLAGGGWTGAGSRVPLSSPAHAEDPTLLEP